MPDKNLGIKPFARLLSYIQRLENMILIALFVLMLSMAVLQIFMREFFSTGLTWGDLMVRSLVLWICLFGAMVTSRKDEHINMDILTRYMPRMINQVVTRIVRIMTAFICLFMAWQGVKLVQLDFHHGTIAFGVVPAWVCEMVIPFGFAVIGFRYLILCVQPPLSEPRPQL